ncbi:formyltransferase family protein [Serratia entomophila]|uniref:formyltransferase family protein n=1 Tax=Serratia entomophila TaxID=42906 RepID=UPI0021780729|nr:formyltransferase family protein [Serratia entomophila]CAI1754085.1 bifunctional UDP-glucuronic acid decarboxylase/UDP-4-amino-4-deoxy-L-arabinose formyltransferase [Serratia entomophila]CAI1794203.1 bifunctional UDP-glucuronic acid decarboxylase/UDP-4-amino-4-deoxy-L-arabinose formyltransferase [Serratia entomophila]
MKNVALFVGNDIFSWLACQDVIGALNKECAFTVYFPLAKAAGRTQEAAIRQLSLYEREVLNDFVFPFISRNAGACQGAYQAPLECLAAAGVKAHRITDINDAAFISSLGNMDAVISLRCYQKFSSDYVRAFSQRGKLLWNLHPGDLPQYRGVMTLFRAMMNGEKNCALTLHEMDENWDAGPVIARLPSELRHELSFLENMMLLGVKAGGFLACQLMRVELRDAMAVERQGSYRYWGFPDAQTLAQAEQAGIVLIDHDAVRQQYLALFVGDRFHPLAGQFCAGFDDFIRAHSHD